MNTVPKLWRTVIYNDSGTSKLVFILLGLLIASQGLSTTLMDFETMECSISIDIFGKVNKGKHLIVLSPGVLTPALCHLLWRKGPKCHCSVTSVKNIICSQLHNSTYLLDQH